MRPSLLFLALSIALTFAMGVTGWKLEGYQYADALYLSFLAFGGDGAYLSKQGEGGLRWQLEVARAAGPIATITAVISIAGLLLIEKVKRLAVSLRRSHVVLVGASPFGLSAARAEAKAKLRVKDKSQITVLHMSDGADPSGMSRRGETHLAVDAEDTSSLFQLMGRPRHIILADREGVANLEHARTIRACGGLRNQRRAASLRNAKLSLRVETGTVMRELGLYAPALGNVSVISATERLASSVVSELAICHLAQLRGQMRPHVLLVGLGQTGVAVAKELCLRSHAPHVEPLRLTVVDRDPDGALERLAAEAPHLLKLLQAEKRISFIKFDALSCALARNRNALEAAEKDDPLTAIIVATGDDIRNIGISMRLREVQSTRMTLRAPVLVRSRRRIGQGVDPITELSHGIYHFGGMESDEQDRRGEHHREKLAEVIHEGWRDKQRDDGGQATKSWDQLDALGRYSNLRAASSAPDMFLAAGLSPDPGLVLSDYAMPESVVESMMEGCINSRWHRACEHSRWMVERQISGFQRAQQDKRDDEKRMHPDLIPFEALSRDGQNKDGTVLKQIVKEAGRRDKILLERSRRWLHLSRGEERDTGLRWRRRLRVAVIGAMFPDETLRKSIAHDLPGNFGRNLEKITSGDHQTRFGLEMLTPNAPGFDRLAAAALAADWTKATSRGVRILCFEALTEDGLDRKAMGLGPRDPLPDVRDPAAPLAGIYNDIRMQAEALSRASAFKQHLDMRPLNTSDAELLRDPERAMSVIRIINRRMIELCDVAIFGYGNEGGAITREAEELAFQMGCPVIAVRGSIYTVAGDWSKLTRLPNPDQLEASDPGIERVLDKAHV